MNKISLDAAIGVLGRLPSMPVVVSELLASFDHGNPDISRLVAGIGKDQGLSARVLRLANSSFYGLQRQVETLNDAVIVLGFRHVRATVAAVAVTRCFVDSSIGSFNYQHYWRHCTGVAIASRTLAERAGRSGEAGFVAGLLHDIGLLVLLSFFREPMLAVMKVATDRPALLIDAEHEVIGIDHALVGEAIAERWHFPLSIREGIAGHHRPEAYEANSLAGIVHLADAAVHAIGLSNPLAELVPPVSDLALSRSGLGMADLRRAMADIEKTLDETSQALFS